MRDPTARAWLLEAMNNRPVFAYAAAKRDAAPDQRAGDEQREAFLAVLESEIRRVYEAHDEGQEGEPRSSRKMPPGGRRPAARAATPGTVPADVPATGSSGGGREGHRAGGTRRRPSCHPRRAAAGGPGASWQRSAPAGLVAAALRLLVAAGHGDTNALTNVAFWAAHPDLFGTKLQPSQPNFAQLSAEWIRLRDGVVRAAHAHVRPADRCEHTALHTARGGNGPGGRGRR